MNPTVHRFSHTRPRSSGMQIPLSDFELGLRVANLNYEDAAKVLANRRDLLAALRRLRGIDAAERLRAEWASIKAEIRGGR